MELHSRCKLVGVSNWCLVVVAIIAVHQVGASGSSFTDELERSNYNLAQPLYDRDDAGAISSSTVASTWDKDKAPSSTPSGGTTSVTVYKEPSWWFLPLLKSMFTDIDWKTIEEAQVQIEKFVRKVEQMVGRFRNIFTMMSGNNANKSSAGGDPRSSTEAPGLSARLWSKGSSSSSTATKMDTSRVKEMLERVACFVGYARLMNLSTEALAELDASKVVTNLFGSSGKRNSSVWKWFG